MTMQYLNPELNQVTILDTPWFTTFNMVQTLPTHIHILLSVILARDRDQPHSATDRPCFFLNHFFDRDVYFDKYKKKYVRNAIFGFLPSENMTVVAHFIHQFQLWIRHHFDIIHTFS